MRNRNQYAITCMFCCRDFWGYKNHWTCPYCREHNYFGRPRPNVERSETSQLGNKRKVKLPAIYS